MAVISAIFWGAILLSVLVFLHEGGHYLAARASGMRVTEFFLGMPCKLKLSHTSKTRGTEIGITPVLLGGYTKICGMEGVASEHAQDILAYVCLHGTASLQEVCEALHLEDDKAVLADLQVFVDWAALKDISTDEAYVFSTVERDAQLRTVYDEDHDFALEGSTNAGEPHSIDVSKTLDECLKSEGKQDLSGAFFEAERANTYVGKKFLPRFITLVAGPLVNIVLGLVTIALVLSIGGVDVVSNVSKISGVTAGSVADQMGLKAGDTITSVAGAKTSTWLEFVNAVDEALTLDTDTFEVTVIHDGESAETTLAGSVEALKSDGVLGVYATTETYRPSFWTSLKTSWNYVVEVAQYVLQLLTPSHTAEVLEQSSSVVGISVMASEAASAGISTFIELLAAVSLSLGFMNLIPLPPLDGGKILIEIVGLIIRRPVSEKVQIYLSYIGLFLLLSLFVYALRQDILRFVLGG